MAAYAVEPVSMTVVGITAACVVAAILVGIGVRPLANNALGGFEQLVNDILSDLPSEFFAITSATGIFLKAFLTNGATFAPKDLVDWITNYVAIRTLPSGVTYSLPCDFSTRISSMYKQAVNLLYSNSYITDFLTEYKYLYAFVCNGSGLGSPYFVVTDGQIDGIVEKPDGWHSNRLFFQYTSEFVAFGYNVISGGLSPFVDYFTGSNYSSPGTIELFDCDSFDVYLTSVYSTWLSDAIPVSDPAVSSTVAVPISVPSTVADAASRSYADTISGTRTVAETVSLTNTDTGTDVGTGTASLWQTLWGWLQKIWTAIKDLVSGITVPITNAIANVRSVAKSIADFFATTMVIESPMTAIHFGALFDLFPFNIPHGIYTAVTFWNATASPPVITIPLPTFSNGSVGIYEFEINFSEIPGMDTLSAIIRGGELILFAIGLLMVTRKVTKW